jgi:hypothetical protein
VAPPPAEPVTNDATATDVALGANAAIDAFVDTLAAEVAAPPADATAAEIALGEEAAANDTLVDAPDVASAVAPSEDTTLTADLGPDGRRRKPVQAKEPETATEAPALPHPTRRSDPDETLAE